MIWPPEQVVPAETDIMTAEPLEQTPNCLPSAEQTMAPSWEHWVPEELPEELPDEPVAVGPAGAATAEVGASEVPSALSVGVAASVAVADGAEPVAKAVLVTWAVEVAWTV